MRAPYKAQILYDDEDFVFKAFSLNISEGGLLLDQLPNFPSKEDVSLLLSIPQYPYFKNFTLLKLQTFSREMFEAKVIRAKCKMVRRIGMTTSIDEVLRSRIGCQFTSLGDREKKIVADYVSVFASNLIYLQMLVDSWNTNHDVRLKTKVLAQILGYGDIEKISTLRKQINLDYLSLQWL